MDIPTWGDRCEIHPDHQSGMVTNAMVQMRMQEEIDDLRDEIERLRKENQTQALDFLASEGEWWELIGKKDKEIELLREALKKILDPNNFENIFEIAHAALKEGQC